MARDGKYGNLDDIIQSTDSDVATAPRKRRPSPAISAMQGNVQPARLVDRLQAEKKAIEEDLRKVQSEFDKERQSLVSEIEKTRQGVGTTSKPISLVMPITKQRVVFRLEELSPELIDVSPENERIQSYLDEISLRDILPSIRKHGQQKPGTVRPKADGRFELIEGSRRLAAVRLSGQRYLALVGEVPDADVRELGVIENKHQDVSPFEKAKAYQRRIESGEFENWTQLGAAMGISSSHIARYKSCVELDDMFVRILPSPSDMPLSYGETISQLKKKGEKALWSKASELLDLRQAALENDVDLFGSEEIIKLLKSAVRAKIVAPTAKKSISYKSKDGSIMLKHSISRRTGSNKFEITGLSEDRLELLLVKLIKDLDLLKK